MRVSKLPVSAAVDSPEDGRGAGGRLQDVHQQLDEGGLAGTVVADECKDGAARYYEVERCESFVVTEDF